MKMVVMYLRPGDETELFTEPLPCEQARIRAAGLERQGYEVIAMVTPEHAAEREQVQAGGRSPEGSHLDQFLDETVSRFRRVYPGVSREAAMEATVLLCTLSLEGRRDLQDALLDEVHSAPLAGAHDWRRELRLAVANRRPDGES